MKKILFVVSFFAFCCSAQSQVLGKSRELKKHESFPVYLWFNPVIDVDSSSLSDESANANTLFLVEGYLTNGTPVLVLINGKTLKFLLRLPTKQKAQDQLDFEGFLFTGESLGTYSIETERKIRNSKIYFEKQKDLLVRNRQTEKWQLWGETPLKVKGKLVGTKFLPASDGPTIKYTGPQ